jgi:transposase
MRAYSPDLRAKIVAAVDAGTSKAEVARIFDVALSTINRYLDQRRKTGSIDPRPIPGRPPTIGPADYDALRAQLTAHPDATLEEHCARWKAGHEQPVSRTSMWRHTTALGWTRKKSPSVPASRTPTPESPSGS